MPGCIFPLWENASEKDAFKVHEIKKEIEKIEYKGKAKVMKKIEVKSFTIKRRVTTGFEERKNMKPFGVGHSEDDSR